MERKMTSVAALMGMTAIILGAFGAHALKKYLTIEQLGTFETGVKYQLYHALFLLFLGGNSFLADKAKKTLFQLVVFGVFFFSGSIYLLATQSLTHVNFKPIGIITPIGGALLIGAWAFLFWSFAKKKQ
ncbi:DUF423 domain-containing protein [Flavobacterium phycosphaerae]|uniref:DUF423 domain-containing protein n=1 Tax=Flavobacterium phycosphaerae TaxID=2697515 RepID=UPI00138A1ECB|nr:DUF423 domain-containing protein [Flavobacterium phycosphaerae]